MANDLYGDERVGAENMISETSCKRTPYDNGYQDGLRAAIPVYCGSCQHSREMKDGLLICGHMNYKDVTPDGYCAWGERK